jgi:hypothetical protein
MGNAFRNGAGGTVSPDPGMQESGTLPISPVARGH